MENSKIFNIPIALIIYNRPQYAIKVIEKIKIINPKKLYVIADGPNKNKKNDDILCNESRDLLETMNFDNTEILKIYSDVNMGCGERVYTGLNYVFDNEKYAIILEDDIVPSLAFFFFCEKMLLKYENDTRIMHISGDNYNEERRRDDNSYFFSKFGHIWGWATWARAWKLMDYKMTQWPIIKKNKILYDIFRTKKECNYFYKNFEEYYNSNEKPWGLRWSYSRIINSGLSIVPTSNLVTNIGILGTHTNSKSTAYNWNADENFSVNKYPEYVVCNEWYDSYHFKKHINYKLPFPTRVFNKIKRTGCHLINYFRQK